MTAQTPSPRLAAISSLPLASTVVSVLSVVWHRLALLAIALLVILVILPAVLGAVGNHWIAVI
jgi:hypothetical protein